MVDVGLGAVRFIRDINNPGQKTAVLTLILPLLVTNVVATALIGYKAW